MHGSGRGILGPLVSTRPSQQRTHPSHFDHEALARGVLKAKPILYDKLSGACDVDRDDAVALLTEVVRFVNLAAHASAELARSLTPSESVDRAWHELILCTREYAALCVDTFGNFVHHDPGGTDDLNRQRFRDTMRLYNLWFGPPAARFWGPQPQLADADCGACQAADPTP